jgi:hypothetical protein
MTVEERQPVHNEVLAHYEKMRKSAIAAGAFLPGRWAGGAALLIRRGMAAWAASLEGLARGTQRTAQRSKPSSPAAASSELVDILSAIILSHCREKPYA